jgi:FkbM family methyltransferase
MANADSNEHIAFRHYTLKHRAMAWVSVHLFDWVIYTVRHGLLKGMKRKGGLGWVPAVFSRGAATAEQEFWSTLDLSGMTVYDAGAFHGLLTLFFASRAKQVISFEPNSRNRRRLMENLALNGVRNVMVCESGLGSRRELLKMAASRLMPGGASVDTEIVAEVERSGQGAVVEEIKIVPLDEQIREAGLPKPDFIKIDIEGFELEALQGARQTIKLYQPALFLEMHGETIREKKRRAVAIVEFPPRSGLSPHYPHRKWRRDNG